MILHSLRCHLHLTGRRHLFACRAHLPFRTPLLRQFTRPQRIILRMGQTQAIIADCRYLLVTVMTTSVTTRRIYIIRRISFPCRFFFRLSSAVLITAVEYPKSRKPRAASSPKLTSTFHTAQVQLSQVQNRPLNSAHHLLFQSRLSLPMLNGGKGVDGRAPKKCIDARFASKNFLGEDDRHLISCCLYFLPRPSAVKTHMNVHNNARRRYFICVIDCALIHCRSIFLRVPKLPQDVQCALECAAALSHPRGEPTSARLARSIPSRF